MKRILFLFCISGAGLCARAQTLTLQQCIDSALQRNIVVRQSGLSQEAARVNLSQARMNTLPYVNADINHNLYNGRSIDPVSNSYVTQTLTSADYAVNSGLVLFNGGSLRNAIRQNEATVEATRQELQNERDNLVLNVILAYLQVLSNEDVVASVEKQIGVSQQQVKRLEVLDKQGAIRPSELSDLKGQLMSDQVQLVTARNTLASARLALAQLVNIPYGSSLQVERIPVTATAEAPPVADAVLRNAMEQLPFIKAAEWRRRSFDYALRTARSGLAPTLSLGGGVYTRYSSTTRDASGKIPYDNQLGNNISTSVGVGLSIPIFNRLLQRNRIRLAEIQLRNSALVEEGARLQLRQQVETALLQYGNAQERYRIVSEQVAAYTESFRAAEVRYNAGVGTSIDYLLAKDRLDRAELNLISARYETVLRKKILDYYETASVR